MLVSETLGTTCLNKKGLDMYVCIMYISVCVRARVSLCLKMKRKCSFYKAITIIFNTSKDEWLRILRIIVLVLNSFSFPGQ
jgi:hypothetical protein